MTWKADPAKAISASELYELYSSHKLVFENLVAFLDVCKSLASNCRVIHIKEVGGQCVASVIVSTVTDREGATLELVPVPDYFRVREEFQVPFREAMLPVLADLFDVHGVRRVTSLITRHRNKTRKAITMLGFRPEGEMQDAVQLRGRDPESLLIYGMTIKGYEWLKKEVGDVAH